MALPVTDQQLKAIKMAIEGSGINAISDALSIEPEWVDYLVNEAIRKLTNATKIWGQYDKRLEAS